MDQIAKLDFSFNEALKRFQIMITMKMRPLIYQKHGVDGRLTAKESSGVDGNGLIPHEVRFNFNWPYTSIRSNLATSLIEFWTLMDTPVEEPKCLIIEVTIEAIESEIKELLMLVVFLNKWRF